MLQNQDMKQVVQGEVERLLTLSEQQMSILQDYPHVDRGILNC
jgi:hypothetical protein